MVQDDRGWSEGVRTVEDGVKTYHIWIRILIQVGFWIPGRGRTDERGSGRCRGGIEDVSGRVHDHWGRSGTIRDGLRWRGGVNISYLNS